MKFMVRVLGLFLGFGVLVYSGSGCCGFYGLGFPALGLLLGFKVLGFAASIGVQDFGDGFGASLRFRVFGLQRLSWGFGFLRLRRSFCSPKPQTLQDPQS